MKIDNIFYNVIRCNYLEVGILAIRKLNFEVLNLSDYGDDIYATVCINGGFITKDYVINGKDHFEANYAFFNVLFSYYRLLEDLSSYQFNSARATSAISFKSKKENVFSKLQTLLDRIFDKDYDRSIFEEAKENAKNNFAEAYKDGSYRAKFKGYEFSNLNRAFSLMRFIQDIENIEFQDFCECGKNLLVPDNMLVFMAGDVNDIDFSNFVLKESEDMEKQVDLAWKGFDPYLRQDAHITNMARKDCNLIIEAFEFLNPKATKMDKRLVVDILSELIPDNGKDIWVDDCDASIMFFAEGLKSYKGNLNIRDEQQFLKLKERLLSRYYGLMLNTPEHYVTIAAMFKAADIDINEYINYLDGCTYELYKELYKKSECIIYEAQVVLRKEK